MENHICRNTRKIFLTFCICMLLPMLAACGKQEEAEESKEVVPTGILAPTAEFTEVKIPLANLFSYSWVGDTLIYQTFLPGESGAEGKSVIEQSPLSAGAEPTVIREAVPTEQALHLCFTDIHDNLYLFGTDLKEKLSYVEKLDPEGNILFHKELETSLSQPGLLNQGFADSQGNFVLSSAINGSLYFFNAEGDTVGENTLELSECNFIEGKEGRVYACQTRTETLDSPLYLQQIDIARGHVSSPKSLPIREFLPRLTYSFTLHSGYGKDILISAPDKLWQYDLESGQSRELLNWADSNINIDGSTVEKLRMPDWNSESPEGMEVLLYDYQNNVAETARIVYTDKAYLPEKQTVTIGHSEYADMDGLIRSFNRNSKEYQVQSLVYDNEMLQEALTSDKEQIPDIIDISQITPQLLVNKGLLEDLEPYFKKSDVVSLDDLLPAVKEAGIYGKHFVGAAIHFNISALASGAEEAALEGWTVKEFFALEEAYPDSPLLQNYTYFNVWNLLSNTVFSEFVDFQKKKCSFDSEAFLQLLEQMGNLSLQDPETLSSSKIIYGSDIAEGLKNQEFLLTQETIYAPYMYMQSRQTYGEKADFASYPTRDGEPWFLLNPRQTLAIYSGSSCKEGAWAFLEYLLSFEEQSWYGESAKGFPVRKDAMEDYLAKPYSQTRAFVDDAPPSEEVVEELRFMVEHMHGSRSANDMTIRRIIDEELQVFCAGDKTAEETAEIIQSRVQLYLDEM